MDDVLIVGGGIVGLSLAFELSGRGLAVRVIDRDRPGRAASWAGAGIVPDAQQDTARHPHEQLAGLSAELHPRWADKLRDMTGIDTGYVRCGGLYLAVEPGQVPSLAREADHMRSLGIAVESLDELSLQRLEPLLARAGQPDETPIHSAFVSPGEAQIRNPRHLRALLAVCIEQGVQITAGVAADGFEIRGGRVRSVLTGQGPLAGEAVCLTAGCWSRALVAHLGIIPAVRPIRGQIALLDCGHQKLRHVINIGPRYLVPRRDGRVLIGSTEEDVGFDASTTASGVAGLLELALGLVPELVQARLERSWAGLRPATEDGLPYLGRVPGLDNFFLATGHFRSGLQLSPATAVVMSQLIRGQDPEIDLSPFRIDRD